MSKDFLQTTEHLQGRQGLYSILNKSDLNLRQIQKLIDSLEIIYGYDLAQIVILISKNEMSGHLNIISDKNEIYGVSFSKGCIVQIDNRDQTTYIGQLLVNEGYLTANELQGLLKDKTAAPIGQELLKLKKLTKDQLIEILLKQTTLRLTQLINSKSIQVSFSNTAVDASEISISYHHLVRLSYDWVFTCLTDQWLNMHYFEFRNSDLVINEIKLNNDYPDIFKRIQETVPTIDIIQNFNEKRKIRILELDIKPAILLRIIHILSLLDCITITIEEKNKILEKDIQLFLSKFQKSTPLESLNLLALFTKSSPNEVGVIIERFNEKIKSLKIDEDLKNNLSRSVISFLLNAELIKSAKNESINQDVQLNSIKNEAKDLIHNKKYFEAFSLLKKLDSNQMKSSKIELYALWCLLGHVIDSNAKVDAAVLKSRLNNIRPEDRYEAEYFYVMALYNKHLGKMKEAQQYYLKSCTMNPKFKDFRISAENPLIKLKNIFKFSLFLPLLFLTDKSQAQIAVSPIKFTNQYYKYVVTEKIIEIAGYKIDLENIEQSISDLDLRQDKENKKCYNSITENYQFKICTPVQKTLSLQSEVLINGEPSDNAGSVILQDIRKPMKLSVLVGKVPLIEFSARKRSIAPYKVSKVAQQNVTKFTFIDLNHRKNIWETTLGVEELTFKLESVTENYLVYQDYIYVNPRPEKIGFDFTLKLPTEVQYSYHRFGLNLLLGFSSFTTKTTTYSSTLNSAIGQGIKLLYERNLDKTQTLYTNLILYSAKITDEKNSVTLLNQNFNLIDFNVGYKKYYDLNWTVSYELNYRNHFTTQETATNSNQFEIQQSYSASFLASPEYTLLETRQWNFISDLSLGAILPQSTPYGKSSLGTAWGLGLKTTYKLRSARLYAGINYDDRSFSAADGSFKNKDFIYSLGYYYLF